MCATPRGIVDNLALVFGRKLFQKACVIRQVHSLVRLKHAQRVRQCHLAVLVMMAIGFAVRSHMDQLRFSAVFESTLETSNKAFPGVEQTFKCNGAGCGAVVKKHRNRFSGIETQEIGARRVD